MADYCTMYHGSIDEEHATGPNTIVTMPQHLFRGLVNASWHKAQPSLSVILYWPRVKAKYKMSFKICADAWHI